MAPPVIGQSNGPDSAGVLGEGWTGANGTGVYGRDKSTRGNGVIGYSDAGRGVWGHSQTGIGVLGESATGPGVQGNSQFLPGVSGQGTTGVYGQSDNGTGVEGDSKTGNGVYGYGSVGGYFAGSSQGIHAQSLDTAGYFDGDVTVNGNVTVNGKLVVPFPDCAEHFDMHGGAAIEAGSVVVIDDDGLLRQCENAYFTKVAGVISGAGSYRPGIILDKQASEEVRQPIALVGKVYCKVDAQYSPIAVGDMLTTSPTPGHAMKAADPQKAFGAVIGKALDKFEGGVGMVRILVSLQ